MQMPHDLHISSALLKAGLLFLNDMAMSGQEM